MDEKVCHSCGQSKPLDAYPPRADSVDGRRHVCRKCKGAHDTREGGYQWPPDEMAPHWRAWNGAATPGAQLVAVV